MEYWEVEKLVCSFTEECGYYCGDEKNHFLCDKLDCCCIKGKIDRLNSLLNECLGALEHGQYRLQRATLHRDIKKELKGTK